MVSKKELLILGAVAVGGLGLASMLAGGEEEGGGGMRLVGIPGISSQPATEAVPGNIYNIYPEAAPIFPTMPSFDWSAFFPSDGGGTTTKKATVGEQMKEAGYSSYSSYLYSFDTPSQKARRGEYVGIAPYAPKKTVSSGGGGWGVGEGAGSAAGGGFTASEQESYYAGGG